MKAVIAFLCCPLLSVAVLHAQDMPDPEGLEQAPKVSWTRSGISSHTIRYPAWLGEELTYDVYWGVIQAGTASLDTNQVVLIDGKTAYRIFSHAETIGFVDVFYRVRDYNVAWMDAKTFCSLGYSKHLHEGRFMRDEWARFDSAKGVFTAKIKNKKDQISWVQGKIPENVQDVLSSFYYIRSQNLIPGTTYTLTVNTQKNWDLLVRVYPPEEVQVPAGKFICFPVEPYLRDAGIFIQKGKKLLVWLTADERKIPVRMQSEVFIGHVRADLNRIKLIE